MFVINLTVIYNIGPKPNNKVGCLNNIYLK